MKYRAFAIMKNSKKEWRVNIFDYDTLEDAQADIERFVKRYKDSDCFVKSTGIEIV